MSPSTLSSCSTSHGHGNFSFLSSSLSVSIGVRVGARRRPPPPVRARRPPTGRASPGVLARPGDAGSDLGGRTMLQTHQHGWAPPCSTRALELGTENEEQKERALQGLSRFLQDRANQKRSSKGRAGTALRRSTSHPWCRCFVQAPASKFIVMRVRPG